MAEATRVKAGDVDFVWACFRRNEARKDMNPKDYVKLDPNERVINIERVMELVSSMEEGAVIRGGQHLMERWGELRKELGLL